MFSFLEASTLFGSKKESSNALVASAFLLLLYDPLLIYQVGFQLSYLAVIAILWIQPWLSGLVTTQNKLLRLLWDTASVTTAAQLGVMPLSLFYFHQFPGLFLVSNVVIIPFLGVLLGCGIIVVLLANFNILPDFVVKVLGYLIDLLNNFIGWVASKEAFVFKHITISLLIMLGMYLVIICIFRLLKKYTYNRLLLAGVALLLFLCILSFEEVIPKKSQLIIFHKGKQTLLAQLSNKALNIKSSDSLRNYEKDSRIKALLDNVALDTIQNSPIPNVISFKSKSLLIVDSLGVYAIPNYNPKYILLRQSPNINLHRLIDTHPNVTIIADGTNYRSDIPRWKATCRKRKIPFHSTYEKGAYIIE
jgi:competence protein ComEC